MFRCRAVINYFCLHLCENSPKRKKSGEPGLVDKVLALHAGSRGFDSHRGHMSERFFRSNRPGYPHPVSSVLEKSGIRVAVGDCSVTERRRWRPPYQTGKTVHVHAKHYTQQGRTHGAGCVQQWFHTAEPPGERRYENWNTHTQLSKHNERLGVIKSLLLTHQCFFFFFFFFFSFSSHVLIRNVMTIEETAGLALN